MEEFTLNQRVWIIKTILKLFMIFVSFLMGANFGFTFIIINPMIGLLLLIMFGLLLIVVKVREWELHRANP